MDKRYYLIPIILIALAWSIAACESDPKMVKRNSGGTPTLTPFAFKATYTSINTQVITSAEESGPDLTILADLEPASATQTSLTADSGETSLPPSLTLTPGDSSPTITVPGFTATTSAPATQADPAASATKNMPSATPKPVHPSSAPAPTWTPSLSAGQPGATATPLPPTATSVTPPTQTPAGCTFSGNSAYENQVITLINQERSDRGLSTLDPNASLQLAARRHSEDMACNDFFSHTGSGGSSLSSRVIAAGYSYSWVAENIAASSSCSFSAQSVVNMWMNSTGHRNNILSENAVHVGVGFRCLSEGTSGDLDAYYTADFGRP